MNWKFWVGIGISVVLIFFLFRGVDYHKLWEASSHANIYLWIPAFLAQYLLMLIRALRWQHLIRPQKEIGIWNLFSATTIGFMSNNLLPARMGEFVRAYVIGNKEDISITSSFATIVVERIFDIIAVLLLTMVLFLFLELPIGVSEIKETVRGGAYGLLVVIIIALFFLVMLVRYRETSVSIVRKAIKPFSERVQEHLILFLNSLASGLEVVKGGRSLFMVSLYSVLNWFVSALPIYIITVSFGFFLPFSSALLILVLLAFAVSVPSSPGYVGPFHYAIYLGLGFYGIGKEEAIGMAIVMHLAQFVPLVVLGLILVWKEKLTLADLRKS
ncbi:MAG: flippase-like domain-containing protein [Deltaproteobacteria bacterium]|nr:flippase-like domain-containing protein [Deltaproteobacteria bacterium]